MMFASGDSMMCNPALDLTTPWLLRAMAGHTGRGVGRLFYKPLI